jgi:uncharacterized repeat protein (TIGR01451 family)
VFRAFVGVAALALLMAAPARAQLPSVTVDATTTVLPNFGAHRGVTVSAGCDGGSILVGGGGYLRRVDNTTLPTNGLVLGGTLPSTGTSPVDTAPADATANLSHWTTIANFTGQSEAGDQAATFALCATAGGPASTVVAAASKVGANATQEVNPPNLAVATCPAGTRLIGGGAATRTPDQVNDGVTVGNNGNLKPLGSYPSDAAGVPAANGSTDATSWSAYGSAGGVAATDEVTAFALCTSSAAPVVRVARVDQAGPDAQPGTTVLSQAVACPAGTRLLGGGYKVDEFVGGVDGLQPQQGYHMRGSFPAVDATGAEVADGATNPTTWMALVQAGGQTLGAGRHMNLRGFALCAEAADAAPDLALTIAADPQPAVVGQPLTYTLTVRNAGGAASGVTLSDTLPAGVTFVSAPGCAFAGGKVTCALGALAAGASASVTIVVTPSAAGDLATTASATAVEADATPADNDASSTVHVVAAPRATPTLTTAVDAAGRVGTAFVARATLAGSRNATGAVSFFVFGPSDATCTGAIAVTSAAANGDGTYTSEPYTPTEPGAYHVIARYAGDDANEPATTACADASVFAKAIPSLAIDGTNASLTGGSAIGGTLTFTVFADAGCVAPVSSFAVAVAGNGSYGGTGAFVAPGPGTYRWVVSYSGDDRNAAVGPTACGQSVITVAGPPAVLLPGPPPSNAFTIVSRKASRAGVLTLKLAAPGPGRFVASAKGFARATLTKKAKGTLTLRLKPRASTKRFLRRHSRLKVTVSVTFTPTGGTPATRKLTLTIKHP